MLLHCSSGHKALLDGQQVDYDLIDGGVDHDMLRRLDDKRGGQFRLLVALDANIGLRGQDLRAPKHGCLLLTLLLFQHERQAQQAAWRVSRYGDPGRRLHLDGQPLIHTEAEARCRQCLLAFITQSAVRVKIKTGLNNQKGSLSTAASHTI